MPVLLSIAASRFVPRRPLTFWLSFEKAFWWVISGRTEDQWKRSEGSQGGGTAEFPQKAKGPSTGSEAFVNPPVQSRANQDPVGPVTAPIEMALADALGRASQAAVGT